MNPVVLELSSSLSMTARERDLYKAEAQKWIETNGSTSESLTSTLLDLDLLHHDISKKEEQLNNAKSACTVLQASLTDALAVIKREREHSTHLSEHIQKLNAARSRFQAEVVDVKGENEKLRDDVRLISSILATTVNVML